MAKNLALKIIFFTVMILVGLSFFAGDKMYKNRLVHGIVEVVDIKDRSCQRSASAVGAECPSGCLPKPLRSPEDLKKNHECRSKLWVWTCAEDCQPREGLVRLPSGNFAESEVLIIKLSESGTTFEEEFEAIGVLLENGISGLYRYRALFNNPGDKLEKVQLVKEKIEEMDGVLLVDYSIK